MWFLVDLETKKKISAFGAVPKVGGGGGGGPLIGTESQIFLFFLVTPPLSVTTFRDAFRLTNVFSYLDIVQIGQTPFKWTDGTLFYPRPLW